MRRWWERYGFREDGPDAEGPASMSAEKSQAAV
jgi:hypothetical protein